MEILHKNSKMSKKYTTSQRILRPRAEKRLFCLQISKSISRGELIKHLDKMGQKVYNLFMDKKEKKPSRWTAFSRLWRCPI